MRGGQLDKYVQTLNTFVERLPALETELKADLEKKDHTSISRHLSDIRGMLIQIHADELEAECLKFINGLVSDKAEKIEARMTYLLSVLTMLSIDIQMAVYKEETEEAPVQREAADEQEPVKKSILAVDDNAFFLNTLKTALQDTGYKLTCVNSGMAALRYLKKNNPDLFILDIDMPIMDGYELARKIRAYGKKAPILFLTGNATREYVVQALKAGAADFIVKPFTQEQVIERIGRHISSNP